MCGSLLETLVDLVTVAAAEAAAAARASRGVFPFRQIEMTRRQLNVFYVIALKSRFLGVDPLVSLAA